MDQQHTPDEGRIRTTTTAVEASSFADPDGPVAPPVTRSERRDEAVEDWRARMLASTTSRGVHMAAALAHVLLVGAIVLILGRHVAVSAAVVLVLTVLAWIVMSRRIRRDDEIRALARLTPVLDPSVLKGEVDVLRAQFGAFLATLSNPASRRQDHRAALGRVAAAAEPIMARDGIDERSASVAGYPAWPEIDRTRMPGDEDDRLTVHLLRAEASIMRLSRTVDEGGQLLQETVARMAGETVPPLRAVAAVIDGL